MTTPPPRPISFTIGEFRAYLASLLARLPDHFADVSPRADGAIEVEVAKPGRQPFTLFALDPSTPLPSAVEAQTVYVCDSGRCQPVTRPCGPLYRCSDRHCAFTFPAESLPSLQSDSDGRPYNAGWLAGLAGSTPMSVDDVAWGTGAELDPWELAERREPSAAFLPPLGRELCPVCAGVAVQVARHACPECRAGAVEEEQAVVCPECGHLLGGVGGADG